jgi:hypothetical protein
MKKQMTKLTLSRETVRNLDAKEMGNALGGKPIPTSGDPTVGIQCISVGCE